MSTNIVSVRKFKKHFGNLRAVDGISFDVKEGEIFGFLGPNGAGKSTTIKCLMGFNRPTSGSINVFGFNMVHDAEIAKRQIGYLSGNVKLYDNWTGWDHIKFFEKVRGTSNNVNELISRFDFNPKAKFRHLSSGNKQKLGLILALMNNPKLLVMDEPTVGLDPLLQFEIHKVLLEMRDKGATIIISSHNLPEVEKLCDRVAIIKSGKLVAVETIQALANMRLHKIEVRFDKNYKIRDLNLDSIDSVDKVGDVFVITSSKDINQVVKDIFKHKVADINISHAALEDVFMKFYERNV